MKLFRSILARTAALALGLAALSIPVAAPAQAAGGSATDWMSQGKFGVMEHYLAEPGPMAGGFDIGNVPAINQWNARVDSYDVAGMVQQLKSIGAGWLQIAVGQNSGYFDSPNSTFDQIVPPTTAPTPATGSCPAFAPHPSLLSQRDLIKDLGPALHAAGIRLMVYVTSDPIINDTYARQMLAGGCGQPAQAGRTEPNAIYQANWLKVVKTWAQQWGTDVDGFWVDGSYYGDIVSFYDQMATELRSGNPNALVTFKTSATAQSDFTNGETGSSNWPVSTDSRWVDNQGTQEQLQYLSNAQGFWGGQATDPMNYSLDGMVSRTMSVVRVGGAVTWDVGFDRDNGHISDTAMTYLNAVGQAVHGSDPDMAIGKTATQSSTGFGGDASRAVDGITNGDFGAGSVTHTSMSPIDNNPWWQIDLGAAQSVGTIKVWNRTDCCSTRLSNFYVLASATPFTSTDPVATASQPGVWSSYQAGAVGQSLTLPVGMNAEYIRVQLMGNSRPLSLAEVQVFADMARDQSTSQSSTGFGADASRAVDGNVNGDFSAGSVTHTSLNPFDNNPWWQVDLGSQKPVGTVKLWNRTDCCSPRLSNFYVFASANPFTSTDPATTAAQPGVWSSYQANAVGQTLTLPVGVNARYIRVQLVGNSQPLSLAEVQVFADMARDQLATQSSTQDPTSAERAVDGDTDGEFAANSVSATNTESNPWWQVDLGSPKSIGSIKVWNRTDCCSTALSNFYVFASATPFDSNDPATLAGEPGVWKSYQSTAVGQNLTLPVGATARYVRVQPVGSAQSLALAEVQVFS